MKEIMKIIPRFAHGILDYVVGILLIAAPWVLGFADDGPATYVPVVLGAGALVYSLLTNYELGLLRIIPFSTHLILDVLSGALLALSPWLFGFADRVYLPHLIVGLFEIAAGLMTRNAPDYSDRAAHRLARSP
jgi:SPW repeat